MSRTLWRRQQQRRPFARSSSVLPCNRPWNNRRPTPVEPVVAVVVSQPKLWVRFATRTTATSTFSGSRRFSIYVSSPLQPTILGRSSSTTTTGRTIPSVSSPTSVWKAWTHQVLSPTGSLPRDDSTGSPPPTLIGTTTTATTSTTAQTCQTLIQWWCRQRPLTTEAATVTWNLWDQYWNTVVSSSSSSTPTRSLSHCQQQQQKQHQILLHSILDHWRLCVKHRVPVPYSTRHVWDTIAGSNHTNHTGTATTTTTKGGGLALVVRGGVPYSVTTRMYSLILSALAYETPTTGTAPAPTTTTTAYSNQRATAYASHASSLSSPCIALAYEILDCFLRHSDSPHQQMDRVVVGTKFALTAAQRDKQQLYSDSDDDDAAAVVVWNSVLTVVAKQGRGPMVGHQAEAILRRMQALTTSPQSSSSSRPNVISYSIVLEAWVVANANTTAGTNAERLLREMLETFPPSGPQNSTSHAASPTEQLRQPTIACSNRSVSAASVDTALSTCFLHVLRAWSKSTAPNGADRANEILQEMISHYQQKQYETLGDSWKTMAAEPDNRNAQSFLGFASRSVKPTRHCFSAVMSGYANRGNLSKVQELLLQLQSLYHASGCRDALLYPSVATFNSVLAAYGKQHTPSSALQAQQLLERLYNAAVTAGVGDTDRETTSSKFRPCYPDTRSVNTVMNAWADSGAPDAVERVEALLNASNEWPGVYPDIVSHTTLMKVWSLSKRSNAPERCEEILRQMSLQYDAKEVDPCQNDHCTSVRRSGKPGLVSYATALYSWSLAAQRNPDAPLRAEAIYRELLQRWQNGDMNFKPTLQIYVSLISAWARSTRKESDIRAQFYFDKVRGKYMAGDESLRPNDKVYNALISSKKRRNDGEGAERILKLMYDDYFSQGNKSAQPNRIVFRNVMTAWLNSSTRNASQRIEAMIGLMQREHKTRKWDCQPNRDDFKLLLQCLSQLGTMKAAIRAEEVLKRMLDTRSHTMNDTSLMPCSSCYALTISAWIKCLYTCPEACIRAQIIFDDMLLRNMQPDDNVYQSIDLAKEWEKRHLQKR